MMCFNRLNNRPIGGSPLGPQLQFPLSLLIEEMTLAGSINILSYTVLHLQHKPSGR